MNRYAAARQAEKEPAHRMDTTEAIRRPRPLARIGAALAVVLAVLLPGTPAWAHNALVDAQPAKNATLRKSPAEVKLRFLQNLNPDFTTIVVSDAAKKAMPAGEPAVDGKTGSVKLTTPLPNGTYTIAYQVVSTDGHNVKGSYTFTVADPAAPASGPAAAPSTPAEETPASAVAVVPTAAEPDSGSSGPLLIGGVVIVTVLAGTVAFLVSRSRRSA
jgi:methionine-rich copper-binding protein CopC